MFKTIRDYFCRHNWEVVHKGLAEYQKGAREYVLFEGTILHCKKCGRDKFIFPKKKHNSFVNCIPLF